MTLTRRQETFMRNLLELYTELQGPIHYSTLAERVGVSRITAYDMLRVLEEKGFVESVYQLTPDRSGPGRSTVLYQPTQKAHQAISELTAGVDITDWQAMIDDIIGRMREGEEEAAFSDVTTAILDRIPPAGPPEIRYCTELITIIVLHLRRRQKRNQLCRNVSNILGDPDLASPEGLMLLAGGAFGMVIGADGNDPDWNRELVDHVKRYHQLVARMNAVQRRQLLQNLQIILPSLCEEPAA